jgi:fucose permease
VAFAAPAVAAAAAVGGFRVNPCCSCSLKASKASGILSTAIAGGAIVSFSQGYLKDHSTWAVAFMIPVICYLYIVFFGINGYKSKA